MICVVYISSAKLGLTHSEIINIVEDSRINNEKNGLTGVMLFNSGNFMQLLEGEDSTVDALYKKIEKDRRHTEVKLLLREPITHRNFSNWTMGFKNIEKLKETKPELLNSFLTDDFNFSVYQKNPYRALEFLETFKRII
ncbi:BLUF domain-containing protein [Cellvibrio mixtus]|uniref:BLUF domain-containing protein n=1 Tax=Cellvibrio mixtus TaxID=39650 RepID=UPI000693659D|nr:BLUF domain-containing protein [Cellvibrio mixtus]